MKRLLIISLVFSQVVCFSQYVEVPDGELKTNLEFFFSECFNNSGQLDTVCAGSANMDPFSFELSIIGKTVKTLEGIQYFDELEVLRIGYADLEEIPALPPNLKELLVYGNELTTLPELPKTLENLNITDNQIGTMPILHEGMIKFSAWSNPLGLLTPLPSTLEELEVSECSLDELIDLPSGLKILDCSQNSIDELPELPLTLEDLNCSSNYLKDLPSLPQSIKKLDIGYNWLYDVPELPPFLERLNIGRIGISYIDEPLPSTLLHLTCIFNELDSLPSVLPPNLEWLTCSGNDELVQLPVVLPLNLKHLIVAFIPGMKCLPSLPETIESLDLDGTSVTCLPNELPNLDSYYDKGMSLCGLESECPSVVGIEDGEFQVKRLLKVVDLKGREIDEGVRDGLLIYIYNDGSKEKKVIFN